MIYLSANADARGHNRPSSIFSSTCSVHKHASPPRIFKFQSNTNIENLLIKHVPILWPTYTYIYTFIVYEYEYVCNHQWCECAIHSFINIKYICYQTTNSPVSFGMTPDAFVPKADVCILLPMLCMDRRHHFL